MTIDTYPLQTDYTSFTDSVAVLALPISASTLHGQLCAFLCMNATKKAENYLQALMGQPKEEAARIAVKALFQMFAVTQQQMQADDFGFQLLLPDDEEDLLFRAEAFSEWCEGFIEIFTIQDLNTMELDEETEEALSHVREFAELDYETLDVSEEDEQSLMEISEFTRMTVLKLYADSVGSDNSSKAH